MGKNCKEIEEVAQERGACRNLVSGQSHRKGSRHKLLSKLVNLLTIAATSMKLIE